MKTETEIRLEVMEIYSRQSGFLEKEIFYIGLTSFIEFPKPETTDPSINVKADLSDAEFLLHRG